MDLPFAKAQLRCGRLPDRERGDVGRPRTELPVRKRPRPLRAAMRFWAAGAMATDLGGAGCPEPGEADAPSANALSSAS